MGVYINKRQVRFSGSKNSRYVDKTGLIKYVNSTLDSEDFYLTCVTRPRRFGKTTAVNMLYAYYDKWRDSRELFSGLEIESDPSYEMHLNKYPVISFSVATFLSLAQQGDSQRNLKDIVPAIKSKLMEDITAEYPDLALPDKDELMDRLYDIVCMTGEKFILLIDEWDCIIREINDPEIVQSYLNFLQSLFKSDYTYMIFTGVYMTGILPIVKINHDSIFNEFQEFTIINPGPLGSYFGFSGEEVKNLCERFHMDYEKMCRWYDGYIVGTMKSIFNPNSVASAINHKDFASYWSNTRSYESIAMYISMDFDGLKDNVLRLLAGEKVSVKTEKFNNILSDINSKDDVLTVLIHLGYLSYDPETREAFVPNHEVFMQLENAVEASNYGRIIEALADSDKNS